MSHLDARPAIDEETVAYVPVRWDLTDVSDKVD